jgi:hypothetical protein
MKDAKKASPTRFDQARARVFWHRVLAFLTQRDSHLIAWEQARQELGVRGSSSRKRERVPIERIVGSAGRYEDFDRAFLPTHDGLRHRWRSIERALETGKDLPPVKLYQVGDAYFVVDGHHRISVARYRRVRQVDAEVIEVRARVPVSDHLDAKELALRGEYARFLERTKLDELRPGQCIEFTLPGGYERLLQYITFYAPGTEGSSISAKAVCDWYDHSYLPLTEVIRKQSILEHFAGRSEADLYVWLMEHQAELRAKCGPDVDVERAAEHYAERHGRHLLTRATSALRDWLLQDACDLLT